MAQLLSNFGADLTGLRQGASCAAREKTPFFLQPIRVCRHALAAMLAGGNDLCSIFRWGRRLPPEALYLLGLKRVPCHAMYHYFYKALTSTRPSTWPRPNRCWAPGRKGPDRSEPWRSTASACAGVPRPGTTAARVGTWWRPLPASLGR